MQETSGSNSCFPQHRKNIRGLKSIHRMFAWWMMANAQVAWGWMEVSTSTSRWMVYIIYDDVYVGTSESNIDDDEMGVPP